MEMSWLGYIAAGMFGLMALGFVFVLVLVIYDAVTEMREERRKQNGNRKANR